MGKRDKQAASQYNKEYRQTVRGRFRTLVTDAKKSARKRGHEFDLCIIDLLMQWKKQNGICAYTGWQMTMQTKTSHTISIERIDNAIGYTPDNVLLVCWCANRARSTMLHDDFVAMCCAVADRFRGGEQDLP